MASTWEELKRRNVTRIALAYAVVSWLVLQLTDVLVSLLALPDWLGRLVFLLLLVGFPLALFLSWAFEITPEGVKREKDVNRAESVTRSTGHKLNFAIIGLLLVALAFFAVDKFAVDSETIPASRTANEMTTDETEHSIAVLPFVNMSSDPEQEYFSDGLSEEILNLLAKIPELKVIGRTSSFAFKGKNEDLRTMGQTLGVKTVLEGSVRKSGDRIRITAQLINVSGGAHIWSETYDRTMTDIFEIQDSVAGEIIDTLKIHVGVMPTRGRPTADSDAYTLFLKAREHLNNWELVDAVSVLENAIARDLDFAEAHEMLAYAYWLSSGTTIKSAEGQRLTEQAARQALDIDPDLVLAQSLAASANIDDFTFFGEIEALERAIRLAPGNTAGFDMLAFDLLEAGYMQEVLDIAERFVDLDPLSPAAHFRRFQGLNGVGPIDEALETIKTADEPGGDLVPFVLGVHYMTVGNDDQAINYLENWLTPFDVPNRLVRDLVIGARDPEKGPAFLGEYIPKMVQLIPDEYQIDVQRSLINFYGYFGHLDRQFEIISDVDLTTSTWTDADDMIFMGNVNRYGGFTAHPKYLEAVEAMGIVELWEQRGPPDFARSRTISGLANKQQTRLDTTKGLCPYGDQYSDLLPPFTAFLPA